MTLMTSTRTRIAASALAALTAGGAAAVFWASQADAASGYHDAAYGISATGGAPIGARPSVSSTDGATHSDSGGARSSDGSVSISSATVSAGGGKASAKVSGFSAFDGLVAASSVSATCKDGKVSSDANGTGGGSLGKKGSVSYGVTFKNGDGSTTIIGMQVHIKAGAGIEAETINVASATCAPGTSDPDPTKTPKPHPTSDKPTQKPTHKPTGEPTKTHTGKPKPTDTTKPKPTASTGSSPSTDGTTPAAPVPTPRKTHLPVTG
jgi:hypothetical protein